MLVTLVAGSAAAAEPDGGRAYDGDVRADASDDHAAAAKALAEADALAPAAGVSASEAAVKPVVLPPFQTPSQKAPAQGLSPVWFFAGLGATLLAGTAATLSGLDANSRHDDFIADGCGIDAPATSPKPADCNRRSDQGAAATLRTNLLFGLTGLLAVNTAVLGAVFVRWSSAPSGGVATIGGTFR
jgi:hypothetical protein